MQKGAPRRRREGQGGGGAQGSQERARRRTGVRAAGWGDPSWLRSPPVPPQFTSPRAPTAPHPHPHPAQARPPPPQSAPIPQKAGLAQEPPEQDLDRWHTPAGTPLTMATWWFPAFTPLDASPWGEPTGGSTRGPRAGVRGGAAHQSCTAAAGGWGQPGWSQGPGDPEVGCVGGGKWEKQPLRPELLGGPSSQGPAEKAGLEVCRLSWRPGGRAPASGVP